MCQIRYFVAPLLDGWTVRRDCRRMGTYTDKAQALVSALQLAAIDRARAHHVEVLALDREGRWSLCGSSNGHLCG